MSEKYIWLPVNPGALRDVLILSWRAGDMSLCEVVRRLFNAGFRGRALDLTARL